MPSIADLAEVYPGLPAYSPGKFASSEQQVATAIGITAIGDDATVDFSILDEVPLPLGWDISLAQIREGDVLLTSRGTSLRTAIAREVPHGIYASSNLHVIRPRPEKVRSEVLWACVTAFLNSHKQAQILRQSNGQVSLPVRDIRALHFDLPSIGQQHALADLIQSMLAARAAARATFIQYGAALNALAATHFRPNP